MLSAHAPRDAGIAVTSNAARWVFMFTPEGPAWRAVTSVAPQDETNGRALVKPQWRKR
jgi:hypothetical protein